MGKAETNLTNKMRDDGKALYGSRLVIIKQHGNEYSWGGVSDLLCCLDGTFIAVEVKAPESYGGDIERAMNEGPSVRQKAFIARVLEAGGIAAVCVTREQFLETLAEADRRNRENCYNCTTNGSDSCYLHPENGPALLS